MIYKKISDNWVILTPSLLPNNNKYYLEITTNDANDNSLKPFTDNMDPSLFGENGTTILENLFKNYISSEISEWKVVYKVTNSSNKTIITDSVPKLEKLLILIINLIIVK